jgi:hypothetical protein
MSLNKTRALWFFGGILANWIVLLGVFNPKIAIASRCDFKKIDLKIENAAREEKFALEKKKIKDA